MAKEYRSKGVGTEQMAYAAIGVIAADAGCDGNHSESELSR
jgi:hypothetical protein